MAISAALIPGPMTFATIGISLKKGCRSGESVFIGHALVELTIFLLILVGISSSINETMMSYLTIIGGFMMVLLGLMLVKNAKEVSTMDVLMSESRLNLPFNPIYAGILTSALNPYFVIWWLAAGTAIILHEYMISVFAVVVFIVGHWITDLGFLVAVSSSSSKGKELVSQRTYKRMLYFCGGLLMVFGLWFLINYNNFSAMI
ncbi:LysE family translocator [Methanococcoides methylutens]|uniref:LysE family translocator n=1 Tax=Methanococcoides methylutens TaxID=2226 RepID=UPI0040439B44